MNDQWKKARCQWLVTRFYKKFTHKKPKFSYQYRTEPLNIDNTNLKMRELISSDSPFMIARFGNTELQTMVSYQKECKSLRRKKKYDDRIVCNAGFFYKEKSEILQFVKLMQSCCEQVDLLGIWYIEMEDYIINNYCKKTILLGSLAGLEPWRATRDPWTELLKNKKIVVVHPFKSTIEHQLGYMDKLFEDERMSLSCNIRIVKAIQTIANNKDDRFDSWFDALNFMFLEVMKEDFDIAIIGCGAYGFPLAAKIKQAGKSAIHLGGATQLLFGIKGKRWDTHPIISKLYNEYWTYPLNEDCPKEFIKVENGCYWNA